MSNIFYFIWWYLSNKGMRLGSKTESNTTTKNTLFVEKTFYKMF